MILRTQADHRPAHLTRVHPLYLLWVAIMAIPAVLWIRKLLVGAGRRVYIFNGGFIIARDRRCRVYAYDELVDTAVWLPTGPARPQIRLRRGTGRWLVINQETAVQAIRAGGLCLSPPASGARDSAEAVDRSQVTEHASSCRQCHGERRADSLAAHERRPREGGDENRREARRGERDGSS